MSSLTFLPFSSSQVPGAVVVNVFGILSTSALVAVLFRVLFVSIRQVIPKFRPAIQPRELVFFNSQLGYYAACLLLADLLSNVSGLLNMIWLFQRGITDDAFCTLQAVSMQVANVAAAYFTVSLSVHTLITLVLRQRQSIIVGSITIVTGWLLSIGIGLIPLLHSRLYGISGISCGIRADHPKSLFFYHLFPIFLAAIVSAILYSVIFLILRGTLRIRGGLKFTLDPVTRNSTMYGGQMEDYQLFIKGISTSLIWFPIAYILLLVPYSVTQLFILSGFPVPFEALVFACVCWFMIGIANVGLLYNVFRVLSPVIDVRSNASVHSSRASSEKGFFDSEKYQASVQEFQTQNQSTASFHRASTSMGSMHTQVNASADYIVPSRMHSRTDSESSARIGRAISPALHLSRNISGTQPMGLGIITEQTPYDYSPSPPSSNVSRPRPTLAPHLRHISHQSADSTGLPAAPRHSRSEVARGHTYSPSSPSSLRSNRYPGVTPSPTTNGRSLTSTVSLASPSAAFVRQGDTSSSRAPMPRESFGAPMSPAYNTDAIVDAYAASGYPRSSYFETYYGQGPPQRGNSSSSVGSSRAGYGRHQLGSSF